MVHDQQLRNQHSLEKCGLAFITPTLPHCGFKTLNHSVHFHLLLLEFLIICE